MAILAIDDLYLPESFRLGKKSIAESFGLPVSKTIGNLSIAIL